MQEFYDDLGFIIGFMVLALIISMTAGEKAQRYFLLATLFSVVILNVNNFNTWFSNLGTLKEGE